MIDLFSKEVIIIIGVFIILYLVFDNFDIKMIVSILVILYFFKEYYKDFKEKTLDIIDNKNNEKKFYKNYNPDIEGKYKELKKYRKINKQNYQEGTHYWKLFMKQIKILEHKDLFNYSHYFDKADMYLNKSVNSFQGMVVSSPEKTLVDGIKYGNYEYSKDLSKIIKDLYKEGYLLLYNFSLRYNEKWKQDPNIYNKQIILDYPVPNKNSDDKEYFLS